MFNSVNACFSGYMVEDVCVLSISAVSPILRDTITKISQIHIASPSPPLGFTAGLRGAKVHSHSSVLSR